MISEETCRGLVCLARIEEVFVLKFCLTCTDKFQNLLYCHTRFFWSTCCYFCFLHRFMSAFEQRVETPPDGNYQFLLFAAEPYETIGPSIMLRFWATGAPGGYS